MVTYPLTLLLNCMSIKKISAPKAVVNRSCVKTQISSWAIRIVFQSKMSQGLLKYLNLSPSLKFPKELFKSFSKISWDLYFYQIHDFTSVRQTNIHENYYEKSSIFRTVKYSVLATLLNMNSKFSCKFPKKNVYFKQCEVNRLYCFAYICKSYFKFKNPHNNLLPLYL